MQEITNEEEKEFEPQYPAQLYTKRPNPTALLSPLYDSTFKGIPQRSIKFPYLIFIMEKMTIKFSHGIL